MRYFILLFVFSYVSGVTAEEIFSRESELSCPTAEAMASAADIIKKIDSADLTERAFYFASLRANGCSTLTK